MLVCYCAFGVFAFGVFDYCDCIRAICVIKRACEIVPVSLRLLSFY